MSEQKDYEKKYDEFWKDIVEVDGVLNLDQIKRELFDFFNVMEEVPKVYMHITGNKLSKPNYDADVVISEADEYQKEYFKNEIIECLIESTELEDILAYFNISVEDINKASNKFYEQWLANQKESNNENIN